MTYSFAYIHRSAIPFIGVRINFFVRSVPVFFTMHNFTIFVFFVRMFTCNQCRVFTLLIIPKMWIRSQNVLIL